jgi:hypothetical protein
MAIVQKDDWKFDQFYHDGNAYVCSSYVAALWKAGGLFDDLEIDAVEWGPKDLYQVQFFDPNVKENRSQVCKDADPEGSFCQLLGKYRMTFPGYNSIKPYSHMNDKCPSIAPTFERPSDC